MLSCFSWPCSWAFGCKRIKRQSQIYKGASSARIWRIGAATVISMQPAGPGRIAPTLEQWVEHPFQQCCNGCCGSLPRTQWCMHPSIVSLCMDYVMKWGGGEAFPMHSMEVASLALILYDFVCRLWCSRFYTFRSRLKLFNIYIATLICTSLRDEDH